MILGAALRDIVYCEVGVGGAKFVSRPGWIRGGVKSILIEPRRDCCKDLEDVFGDLPNVKILNLAITKETNGLVTLFDHGIFSFIEGVEAAPIHFGPRGKREIARSEGVQVEGKTWNRIDPGNISILFLDMEGSEWNVVKRLKSRPRIIRIEMIYRRKKGRRFKNQHYQEILEWMEGHGYIWFLREKADVYFLKV